jgi:non-ribosomal peptide synthetase component E (peptide arylation enzyme)
MEGVFDSEGFYKTGDLGSIGPNREIFILGRASQDGQYQLSLYRLGKSLTKV